MMHNYERRQEYEYAFVHIIITRFQDSSAVMFNNIWPYSLVAATSSCSSSASGYSSSSSSATGGSTGAEEAFFCHLTINKAEYYLEELFLVTLFSMISEINS
jgi:hypothetical protein